MKLSKEEIFYVLIAFILGLTAMLIALQIFLSPKLINNKSVKKPESHWQIESIDTMKFSRDAARQGLSDETYPNLVNKQIREIASTGANYVAIDTPYDAEFLPVLKLWVQTARAHGLHVWFRGNFSGWEGWFNYPQMNEQDHIANAKQFILTNKRLFQDGDIFTSCPECENGIHLSVGDAQAVASYRQFLITEYNSDNDAFAQIGKKVNNGYFSMNADVARTVMDRDTTQALGGVVVIDHYVETPEDLANGVRGIAEQSGGNVVLGEFGAPIPDINGDMTDDQQKIWLDQSLRLLLQIPSLKGMNYWVSKGGSTALWNDNDSPKSAVTVITKYYTP